MRKFVVALFALAVLAACAPPPLVDPVVPEPSKPVPLVLKGNTRCVVDGGVYESIQVDGSTCSTMEIKNVRVDGSQYSGDPLQRGADCLYVIRSGNVTFHDSICQGNKRQGVAVISTTKTATVFMHHLLFQGVRRYTFDFEPNLSTQHIHNLLVEDTKASQGFGWLIRHSGCCDSVVAHRNEYMGVKAPEGSLGSGVYGRCHRTPFPAPC